MPNREVARLSLTFERHGKRFASFNIVAATAEVEDVVACFEQLAERFQ